jgi:hypothetical protein
MRFKKPQFLQKTKIATSLGSGPVLMGMGLSPYIIPAKMNPGW